MLLYTFVTTTNLIQMLANCKFIGLIFMVIILDTNRNDDLKKWLR